MENLTINEIIEILKNKLESKNLEKIENLTKALKNEKEKSQKKLKRMVNYYTRKIERIKNENK